MPMLGCLTLSEEMIHKGKYEAGSKLEMVLNYEGLGFKNHDVLHLRFCGKTSNFCLRPIWPTYIEFKPMMHPRTICGDL